MPKFKVKVYREWKECGEMEIEADTEEEAKEQAEDSLSTGDDGIEWDGSNMTPEGQGVESCEEV